MDVVEGDVKCDFGILLWLFCIVYVQYGYTLQYVGTMDLVELCPRRML